MPPLRVVGSPLRSCSALDRDVATSSGGGSGGGSAQVASTSTAPTTAASTVAVGAHVAVSATTVVRTYGAVAGVVPTNVA